MTSLKNNFLRSSTALYLWFSTTAYAFAIDLGEVPEGLSSGTGTIEDTVTNVVVGLLKLMALVATIVIIIAGVRMVVSQGDDTALEKAKKTILWAIVGLILIIIAGAIVQFVGTAVQGTTT
ncbi:TrbC/VirB2 family protein [Patescibacteria group bacterium]|nr:TrbC/VirB2 family protein [Patescibacteria group bacterium]